MNIPEKYRDRYENLTRSHPWMREMRDEQAPEGDVVAIMRKAAKGFVGGHGRAMGNVAQLIGMDSHAVSDSEILRALADMVERDYVRRDDYDFMADALKYMKAERDELERKLEAATNANDDYRDEWHRVCAERDRLRRDLTDEKNKRVEVTEKWAELKAQIEEIRRTLSE